MGCHPRTYEQRCHLSENGYNLGSAHYAALFPTTHRTFDPRTDLFLPRGKNPLHIRGRAETNLGGPNETLLPVAYFMYGRLEPRFKRMHPCDGQPSIRRHLARHFDSLLLLGLLCPKTLLPTTYTNIRSFPRLYHMRNWLMFRLRGSPTGPHTSACRWGISVNHSQSLDGKIFFPTHLDPTGLTQQALNSK